MWRNRDFLLALAGKVTSLAGDNVLLTALGWAALKSTGSVPFLALVTTVPMVVGTLLGPVGGVYLDGPHRRRVMILADLGRAAALLAFLAVLIGAPQLTWGAALVALALLAGGGAFFNGGSILPNLVAREELKAATAVMNTAQNWAKIAAPPLGGALIALVGLGGVVVFDVLTFLASAACLALIRAPFVTGARRQAFRIALAQGARFVWGHGPLRTYLLLVSLINAGISLFVLSIPVVVLRVLGGGAVLNGAVQGAYQAGMILTGVGLGVLGAGRGVRDDSRTIALGLLGMAAGALLFALPGSVPLAVLGAALFGLALMFTSVLADARIYAAVPDELRGRGFALVASVSNVLRPVAVNVGGVLAQLVGPLAPALLIGLASYTARRRALDEQREVTQSVQ